MGRLFGRLDRYILRELIPPFFVATIVVLTMFQVNLYIFLGKSFDLSKVPLSAVLKLILYQSPGFLNLTLPIGVALATSIGMSRLARESEITAMRASGVRILRIMWPVALFGICAGLINLYVVDRLTPQAEELGNKLRVEVGILGSSASFQANLPLKLKQYTVSLGQVTRNSDDSLSIKDVLLIERPEANVVSVMSTKEGRYANGVWTLSGGYVWTHDVGTDKMTEAYVIKEFVINERIIVGDLFSPRKPIETSISELGESIVEGRRRGTDVRRLEVEYHVKFSVPLMCLIFALVCPIFSIALAKHGGFIGVLVSLVIVMGYYNVWVVSTQILSKVPSIEPWQAAWIPNIILTLVGLYGLRRLE